jgi:two-component system, LytTR family, response regulator
VKLHVGAESHMLRATMADMEKRLVPAGLARIHRSRLVNLDRVKELRPMFQGESIVVLKSGTRLGASRGCLKDLQDRLDC